LLKKKIPIKFELKKALAFLLPEDAKTGVPKHILVAIQLITTKPGFYDVNKNHAIDFSIDRLPLQVFISP